MYDRERENMREFLLADLADASIAIGEETAYFTKESEQLLKIKLPYQAVYGTGERYHALNLKNRVIVNKVVEKFCEQGELTYCPIPFFFTNTGLGVWIDTEETVFFDFTAEEILIYLPAGIRFYVFTGTPPEILAEFVRAIGKPKLPPKWAFGPWISANHWHKSEDVEEQLDWIHRYQFPVSVIVLEAWSDESTFYLFHGSKRLKNEERLQYENLDFSASERWKSPRQMVDQLHQDGIRLVLWQIPVYKKLEMGRYDETSEADWQEAIEKGYCAKYKDGSPYYIPDGHWFAGSLIPDFTNAETVKSWFEKRNYLLEMGVDGFKTDGGEFIYSDDVLLKNGFSGKKAKNFYAQSYVSAYSDFVGRDRVLFSRAGYLGTHTATILWAGDQQSSSVEMKSVLKAGLSAALSGIFYWGFDIAGFAGKLPSINLYLRATQMACFCPIMQWHSEPAGGQFKELMAGAEGNNERSPWNMAMQTGREDVIEKVRFWHYLRMNLLPYIYDTALKAERNAEPMIRPLGYNYYEEPVHLIEDQFLLGESLLIAPILDESASSRKVYLPAGKWIDFFTGKIYTGKRWIMAGSDERLPVFQKTGTAVACNLPDSLQLGENVGNSESEYQNLHFLLAGESGRQSFRDNLGNDFIIFWQGDQVKTEGQICHPVSWRKVAQK